MEKPPEKCATRADPRRHLPVRRVGFTLVELMIVIAIMGILAAIAVPQFIEMQLKAKRAELPSNVDGIKTAEFAYGVTFDEFIELPLRPRDDAALDKDAVSFDTSEPEWKAVGWVPDGPVRGNYQVGLSAVDHPDVMFLVIARSDLDDDDALCEYQASEKHNATITELRQYLY